MEDITFDAMTAAVMFDHLGKRGLPHGLVAWLMMESVRSDGSQQAHRGVKVTVTSWSGRGDPVVPGGDPGVYSMNVTMPARDGAGEVRCVGHLRRHNGRIRFDTAELGLGGKYSVHRSRKGVLRLEIRERLPDTILSGLAGFAGRPLRDVVDHPALHRTEAEGVTIIGATEPNTRFRTRVGVAQNVKEGIDIEIEAPPHDVPPRL